MWMESWPLNAALTYQNCALTNCTCKHAYYNVAVIVTDEVLPESHSSS
jgi:hypothetical protein